MFEKILIANRGEIACRVIKTAKRLGIKTVAVYSDVDTQALHVRMADQAIHIGAAPASDSYLRAEKILAAAKDSGAQAIHPGYGFLSENAEFAQACTEHNIVFIGPPASAIMAMGSKSAAKSIMEAADVPLVPGYHGDEQSPSFLKQEADKMGYPVLLKATAGGGGKGMRQVWTPEEFDAALTEAKSESKASFGDEAMLVEKYLTSPRHVEVQVFCDQHNNGVYLFERDCSLQRRHQKVIEEAPAPNLSDALRRQMGETAVRAAQAINYQGAGTVEFLLEPDNSFYFMEMNTRLQVEHPVTEMITGLDLVEWQLHVANGEPLPLAQEQLRIQGHAVEARIYAEDPAQNFMPMTGTIDCLRNPSQADNSSGVVRVDTGVVEGDSVSAYYDPMIAKLICWGDNRKQALAHLATALEDYFIAGLTTNIEFLHDLVSQPDFIDAKLSTRFIEEHEDSLAPPTVSHQEAALASVYLTLFEQAKQKHSIWGQHGAWKTNHAPHKTVSFTLAMQDFHADVKHETINCANTFQVQINERVINVVVNVVANINDEFISAQIDGKTVRARTYTGTQDNAHALQGNQVKHTIKIGRRTFSLAKLAPNFGEQNRSLEHDFRAPMNGTIVALLIGENETVNEGDALMVLEAMKMQHTILAPNKGKVTQFYFGIGDLVDGGATLLDFSHHKQGNDEA